MIEGKKAQLTLLVIVGIVLLFSVVLIVALQQRLVTNQLQAQAQASISDFIQLTSLEQYVTSCLQNVATEGVQLLGKQGGVLYDYQGGLTPSTQLVSGLNYLPYNQSLKNSSGAVILTKRINISYAIGNTVFCPGTYIFPQIINLSDETTGYYPVKDIFFDDYPSMYTQLVQSNFPGCNGLGERTSSLSGYLGSNTLPKLCSYNGSNAYDATQHEVSCLLQYYDKPIEPFSLQRQLESFVKNNLDTCVDLSYYEQDLANFNITVDTDAIVIHSTFKNPRGIIFHAEYPFVVTLQGSKSIYKAVDFQSTIDVNIKRLYDFVYRVIFNMVRDPHFVLAENYTNVTAYVPSLSVKRIKNACDGCTSPYDAYDDVLVFTDESSRLRGEPFIFQVATKQKKPILDYVHDPTQETIYKGEVLDFLFLSNGTVQFFPNATDSDEDNITYTYFGWKETYDQWFNSTKCEEDGCDINNHENYIKNISIAPHKLSSSALFLETEKDAGSISVNKSDLGYHEIQLLVEDEHGAQDFQTIKFLVFDVPIAVLETYNDYLDINDSFASLEDGYHLDGAASTASVLFSGSGLSKYIFADALEPFFISTTAPSNQLDLPLSPYTFSTIVNGLFSNESALGVHEISLVVTQNDSLDITTIYSQPTVAEVTVTDCLPHGYDPLSITSYDQLPLQSNANGLETYWGYDQFEQPHVCCEPTTPLTTPLQGGTIKDTFATCFSTDLLDDDFITCYPLNDDSLFANRANVDVAKNDVQKASRTNYEIKYGLGSYDQDFKGGLLPFNTNDQNDIFRVTQTQQCSGLRGNSCGGKVDVEWDTVDFCADLGDVRGVLGWQFARCSGPGTSTNGNTAVPLAPTACVGLNLEYTSNFDTAACANYSQGSFEKNFLGVTEQNHPGFSPTEGLLIEQGFCAPTAAASIDFSTFTIGTGILSLDEAGEVFSCQATCSAGACDYTDLSSCSCAVGGSNSVCDGLLASDFISSGSEGFYCSGATACTSSCTAQATAPITTKEACYCSLPAVSDGTYSSNLVVPEFFDPTLYTSSNTGYCCSGNTIISSALPLNSAANSCYKGTIANSGDVLDSIPGGTNDQHILSCNGQLFSCGTSISGVNSVSVGPTLYCGEVCTAVIGGSKWT